MRRRNVDTWCTIYDDDQDEIAMCPSFLHGICESLMKIHKLLMRLHIHIAGNAVLKKTVN